MAMSELARQLQASREGDEASTRALFERYRPRVLRLLDSMGSLDADEQEDVAQDTFARAFRSLGSLTDPSRFEAWLYAIARNRARTALERRQNRERTREQLREETDLTVEPVPASLQVEVEAAMVRELIEALPPGPERETVYLFYVEGSLSTREIAERLGVGKSAVTMRLERFRARVKRDVVLRTLKLRGALP
jgi:RNA polymerase sigma-70 factor (ECF subfamily)